MVGIHHRENSFSTKWIEYCELNDIQYKIIDCYKNNIIEQVKDCEYILWHWHHTLTRDALFAKQLIHSFELMGKKVFPDSNTSWHYDDKVGQKYLFESINAPFINTYVFYNKKEAIEWVNNTSFPKIFKLRGGAGANNVSMCKTKKEAIKKIDKAFSSGFGSRNKFYTLEKRIWQFKRDKTFKSFLDISKGIGRIFFLSESDKNSTIEKNYVYFQDFIPNNDCDYRIVVIGEKAFGFKRMVRDGDFRASGSGKTIYDKKAIPEECLKIAFETTKKIKSQSTAYDFVYLDDKPVLIEVSFSFSWGYKNCNGYWDSKLNWTEKKFFPEYFMIEDVMN